MLPIDIQLFAEGGEGAQGDAGSGQNGGNAGDGGNGSKTYTQEELDSIVNERTGRATKAALKSFFSQKGLSEEEATQAMSEYLENKKKNTPDVSELSSQLSAAQSELARERLERAAEKAARKLGADEGSIGYVVTLADLSEVVSDGKLSEEKLTAAVKKVLDDVPAFKKTANGKSGVTRVGGDGEGNDGSKESEDALRKLFGLKPKK